VKPKTYEFLNILLWTADGLLRPSFRNLTDSYESWAYRKGLLRQVATLEKQQLIERNPNAPNDRIYRLSEQGRIRALGGRDPVAHWARKWDGVWRLVVFDVPVGQNARRERLRRYLREKGFGCLQGSIWITPTPLKEEQEILANSKVEAESLLLLEARPCGGENDSDLVNGAWDFDRINCLYSTYVKILERCPLRALEDPAAAIALQRWATEEREAWMNAVSADPLLPECLWPSDYYGRHAWERRVETLEKAGQLLRTFAG
jgi:phenylacetic acid degradation operon negative regulatory protein